MHTWAITVERFGNQMAVDLKSGRGPAEVLDFMRVVSQAMAMEEAGDVVTGELAKTIDNLRVQAVPFLQGATR